MNFKFTKFYTILVFLINSTTMMAMEQSNTKLPINIPERVSFLHDQIVFEKDGGTKYNPEFKVLNISYNLELKNENGLASIVLEKPLIIINLNLIFKKSKIHVTANDIEIGRLIKNKTNTFIENRNSKISPIVLILAKVVNQILINNMIFKNAGICASCQKSILIWDETRDREGELYNIYFYPFVLFHCGHIVNAAHMQLTPVLLHPNGDTHLLKEFQCPQCGTTVSQQLEDFLIIN
ncbi:MAG: hypothetical protein WC436_04325 [Candidatus Babeliales bacterium]